MNCLVLGATGGTGRLLVSELLRRRKSVTAIARVPADLGEELLSHPELSVVQAAIGDLPDADISRLLADCDSAASCLGHSLSLRGVFGPPHRLVTDATRRICDGLTQRSSGAPARFVLMNTAGIPNAREGEAVSRKERMVLAALRALLPPHSDNEQAVEHLHCIEAGSGPQWVAVRPDSLFDEGVVTDYDVVPSPTRSAIFNAGRTSRINVAHFMAELLTRRETWERWRGKTPVIYNRAATG